MTPKRLRTTAVKFDFLSHGKKTTEQEYINVHMFLESHWELFKLMEWE